MRLATLVMLTFLAVCSACGGTDSPDGDIPEKCEPRSDWKTMPDGSKVKHGHWWACDEYAQWQKRSYYEDGELSRATLFKDGLKQEDCEYRSGARHGKYTAWHKNGQPAVAGQHREGRPCGEWLCWDEHGLPTGCGQRDRRRCKTTTTGLKCDRCDLGRTCTGGTCSETCSTTTWDLRMARAAVPSKCPNVLQLVVQESDLPFIGVSRLSIALTGGQPSPLRREYVRSTFWNIVDGGYEPADGLVVESLPVGKGLGLSIAGYDSTGLLVTEVTTGPVEMPFGGSGSRTIHSRFTRQSQVGKGTLILTLKGGKQALHDNTKALVLVIPLPAGGEHRRTIKVNRLEDLQLPLVITNIPLATSRKFTLVTKDAASKKLQTWQGIYTIASPTKANQWVDQVELVL